MIEHEKEKKLEEAKRAVAEKDRYFGMLIEDTNGKYETIIEVVTGLEKTINDFQSETRGNFQMFFEWFSAHDEDKADKKDVLALEHRVTRLEEKAI